jgi:histidinol-phosphatase (PHP family)
MHSHLCRHGEGEIDQYVEKAIEIGLSEIGFAEHIPIPELDDPTGRMDIRDFPVYLTEVAEAQKKYPEITVRLGLEADYLPGHMDFISAFIQRYPFDFVIGSVHFIGDWDFSNPVFLHRFEEFGVDSAWISYYRLLTEAASTGLYDIIGHFDVIKKFKRFPSADIAEHVHTALQAIKENDLVLDVNTGGKRGLVREIYPSPDILQLAREMDIPVILGSDAHAPGEVASFFPECLTTLRQIGYSETVVFSQRRRSTVPM